MRVLVTRPQEEAVAFASELKKNGLQPVLCPLTNVTHLRVSLPDKKFSHIVFTSRNGVKAFAALTDKRDLPVFAVGEATANLARGLGFTVKIVADNSVGHLAALIPLETSVSETLLYVCGQHRAGDLQRLLNDQNRECEQIILYEAKAVEVLPDRVLKSLESSEVSAATFFSPRAAQIFLRLLPAEFHKSVFADVRLICLSERIADVFKEKRQAHIIVTKSPDTKAMIDILSTALT